ncbi:hypothetical protein CK203_053461 [Vitis vinifera]|uniref:PB1 domain-containing protein n=1 Tax=Vitis vinifera TaxID=29760 RepID=A0A438GZ37_VITVI|nr:hypothetical protein CK203_053461 [Vitis vinifera]
MESPPPPPNSGAKLRLMCSYNGHILPRRHAKSLCYAGGDTRIVAVDRRATASLSALTTQLSQTLQIPYQFTLKYQLPHHDSTPLFRSQPTTTSLICSKSTTISPPHLRPPASDCSSSPPSPTLPGRSFTTRSLSRGSWTRSIAAPSGGLDSFSVPESVVLETNSSFGSTSSSVSVSNLAAMRAHVEDSGVNLQDKKVHLPLSESIESETVVASVISHPQTGGHEDPVVNIPLVDNWDSSKPVGSESNVSDAFARIQIHKAVEVSGFPSSLQLDQQQQQLQFVPAGAQYITHYPTGPVPVSSYYPIYHHRPPQPYNFSMQGSLIDSATVASSQPPMHLNATMIPSQVVYKEVTAAPPLPDLATKIHHPTQSIPIASMEAANYSAFEDDPAQSQIYKSQPPAPILPSQYQTMTNATKALLSEALAQSQADNIKQQIRTPQPK